MTRGMQTPIISGQLDQFCNELLSLIELREAGLLNWGFIDVRSDLDREIDALLDGLPSALDQSWEQLRAEGMTSAAVLTNLVERRLLFRKGGRYRTRFAETVRLLALLRQRFSDNDWSTASHLVSDMRIELRRRHYPRRDIPPEDLLDAAKRYWIGGVQQLEALAQLLQADGQTLVLAAFQRDAMLQLARMLTSRGEKALVIGAGTGAGKTKAFYAPAMAEIAATLDDQRWAQVLALYPRIELLKDQLAEAYTEARKLDRLQRAQSRRPIALGAYYGDTPQSAARLLHSESQVSARRQSGRWERSRHGDGWICPFFKCPNPSCNGEMVWHREDVEREEAENRRGNFGVHSRLRCSNCGFETDGAHLLLTREHLVRQPPDILFTTTEMLNRRLSNAREHALFGVHTSRPPKLMLLDEIHTYEGLTGAQVAYLLRRWRHARGYQPERPLGIVGLSATLTQAEEFFTRLTGIARHEVRYIAPRPDELIDEGMEYNVVLKGDPVSGTSLLSTSVQTAMLVARALDPLQSTSARIDMSDISHGAFGRKIFAFTDKLDVINRWFHIETDAERNRRLSQYRKTDRRRLEAERMRRRQAGQEWWMCEEIGHDLDLPLRVDLVSSQYQGVDPNAQLVIATSSLEVGFNDPMVGAVIQHKAPRSMASFLQRKGRAGRTRAMRPWTIVATSAYGRDRWAFQHAESLFDPNLPPLDLPVHNYYIRKIQAAYALMDWLAIQLRRRGQSVDMWDVLASGTNWQRGTQLAAPRRRVASVLEQVLSGALLDDLTNHLRNSLGFRDDEPSLHSVLWDEPRSLLFDVIPTLLRRLESQWQAVVEGESQPWSDHVSTLPMPDYAPSSLFADLNLPEIQLRIPSSGPRNTLVWRDDALALEVCLHEFAPGHVSKRYSRSERIREAHWLDLPNASETPDSHLPLEMLKLTTDDVPIWVDLHGEHYQVFRPRAYELSLLPLNVKDSSSARFAWQTRLEPAKGEGTSSPEGLPLELTAGSEWRRLFASIHAFTHERGARVEVTRLATAVTAVTRYQGGGEVRRSLAFTHGGAPAALGFATASDALRVRYRPLEIDWLMAHPDWPKIYRDLSPQYLLARLRADQRLAAAGLSSFEIDWLWQLHLSMLVAVAIAEGCSLAEAAQRVASNRRRIAQRTLDVIFQSLASDEDDEEQGGRLHQRLLEVIEWADVQAVLRECEHVLWNDRDAALPNWLASCYSASLSTALFTALTELTPDIDPEALRLDVDESAGEIWISEAAGGGVGLIARIAEHVARHPRHLDLQLLDTVQNCDRQLLATHLRSVADIVRQPHDSLVEAFEHVRESGDLPRQEQLRGELANTLEEHGIPATRELVVALHSKFLRPNSGRDSDELIAALVARWEAEEQRLGCTIDLRVMAVAATRLDEVSSRVGTVMERIGGAGSQATPDQIYNLLQSLLWLDCHTACPDCIDVWQPYQEFTHPSRALLWLLIAPDLQTVTFGADDWEDLVREQLTTKLVARVGCQQEQLLDCKQGLLELLVEPIEIGYQLHYPTIDRVARSQRVWIVTLVVAELVQE